jgi:predicted metal-dependent HD superfamily phosphohydrolase
MSQESTAEARWRETWRLAGAAEPAGVLARLLAGYAEPHRAYHDLAHILDCLGHAAAVRSQLAHPHRVELALWFHDVVYQPRAADNEERSAELAVEALRGWVTAEVLQHVHELILATRHPSRPAENDARYLVDIDLAILGASPATFDAYEAAIRREYRWVPRPLYRRQRKEVLRSFLALDRIYLTDHFARRCEEQARANLRRSISRL